MRSAMRATMSGWSRRHASSHRVSRSSICRVTRSSGARVDQLVQREGGTARTAGGRAGQDEPAYPLRVADGHLLGHHAAEGDPEDEAVVPADGVEERGGVVGEVRHGVGPGRHAALAEAALVVRQDLERLCQRAVGSGPASGAGRRRCPRCTGVARRCPPARSRARRRWRRRRACAAQYRCPPWRGREGPSAAPAARARAAPAARSSP